MSLEILAGLSCFLQHRQQAVGIKIRDLEHLLVRVILQLISSTRAFRLDESRTLSVVHLSRCGSAQTLMRFPERIVHETNFNSTPKVMNAQWRPAFQQEHLFIVRQNRSMIAIEPVFPIAPNRCLIPSRARTLQNSNDVNCDP